MFFVSRGKAVEFVWQAGFVLVFNQGTARSPAFLARMLVVPMRSKFVSADEAAWSTRFDLAKLKSITGGAPMMAVRGAGAAAMTHFRWSAFVLIACNRGCLPQFDASDIAFVPRMIPVPMRAKFNDAEAAAGVEPYSFPVDLNVQEKLSSAKMAVMHVLIAARR